MNNVNDLGWFRRPAAEHREGAIHITLGGPDMKEYNYAHGGDIYRHPIEYDFSVNINPLGMPLASIQAAHEGIVLAGRYPDYKAEQLCKKISEVKGIPQESILVGNGAAELIYALCRALPGRALALAPTFTEYEHAVLANHGGFDYVRMESFFSGENPQADADALIQKMDNEVGLVFLCNPNNPTGTLYDRDTIIRILKRAEAIGAYLCVDECFLPFFEEETDCMMLPLVETHPHLIVLRAFTKIYCMAGLRLGYLACSDSHLRKVVRTGIQPWNTSIPAQLAGIAALSDVEYIAKTRENLILERNYLVREVEPLVSELYIGKGNFLLFRAERDLKERMLEQGVLVRSCEDFEGLDDSYYRIGIRSHSENQELIRRWKEIYNRL